MSALMTKSARMRLLLGSLAAFFAAAALQAQTISGQVTFEGGAPRRIFIYGSDGLERTLTDRYGRYSFKVRQPGTYVITPFPRMRHLASPASKTVEVTTTDVTGVDFTIVLLACKGALSGRITRNKVPLEGVGVYMSGVGVVNTDRNGIYTFSNIPAGRYYVAPYLEHNTFSPAFREVRLRTGRNLILNFKAVAAAETESYSTYFSGLWDVAVHVTETTCPTTLTGVSGIAAVTQKKKTVYVRLPRLGTFKGEAAADSFAGHTLSRRQFCRVQSDVSAVYSDLHHASLTGTLMFRCLLQDICRVSIRGTLTRK